MRSFLVWDPCSRRNRVISARGVVRKSVFQHSALASGLLSQEDLDEALAALRAEGEKHASDERLAQRLVSMGRINAWQAEQLRSGRTKFTLGPYRVIDSIGQGGMGQVFKAEHSIMGRVVAVKVLPRSRSTPEAIAKFSQEIRAQALLDHENLVRAYDAGHDGNVHFLVTEYVPGNDLRKLIRAQGPLSMPLAASICSQAARGLEHAHGRGLIHRDVKPANILVTPDGHTKVSDLGLAGYFNEAEQTDVYGGKVVGTADYLAPEQILQPDKPTHLSDIYSLGCAMYYAVTGKVPFPGGTAKDKARAHCTLPPLDPRRLNIDLSDDFVDVIADMMAKDLKQRIQSAGQVAQRLAPWVGAALPAAAMPMSAKMPLPPPVQLPSSVRPVPASPLGDTEPYFLVQPSEESSFEGSSSSQASLGTQPVGAAGDETMPEFRERFAMELGRGVAKLSPNVRLGLAIGAAGIVAAATAIVVRFLWVALTG